MNKKSLVIIPILALSLVACGGKSHSSTSQQIVNRYTVTWEDFDGTVLEVDENVKKGDMPSYDGKIPTREPSAKYTYAFKEWSPKLVPVVNSITYRATYTGTINEYTITWKNDDGTVLKTDTIAYGVVPEYVGEQPQKERTDQYIYSFDRWYPEPVVVTGDATYTATFTTTTRSYTIKWVNYDGTVLERDTFVPYGSMPTYDGATPSRPDDEDYSYTFKGWSPEVVTVTGAATYTAQFNQTPLH